MKKILKITALALVSVLLLLSIVSCGKAAPADANGDCGSGLTWSYSSETGVLSITGNGTMTDFASVADQPWRNLASHTKTVTVSDGVQNIGDNAFHGFSALQTVNLPTSVATVGKSSFAFCTALTSATLPTSLTTIKENAFEGCSALTTAVVPASVTSLGANAFAYCYSLKNAAVFADVALPEGVFMNCRSLEGITLFAGITDEEINENAFRNASKTATDALRTENSNALAKVTVNYVLSDGGEAPAPTVEEGKEYGASYSIVSPTIEGYTADKLTVTGTVHGVDVTETVTYTKNAPAETTAPEEPAEDDEPVNWTTILAVVILGVVLVGIAVAAFFIVRADKKNSANASRTVRKNDNTKRKK